MIDVITSMEKQGAIKKFIWSDKDKLTKKILGTEKEYAIYANLDSQYFICGGINKKKQNFSSDLFFCQPTETRILKIKQFMRIF